VNHKTAFLQAYFFLFAFVAFTMIRTFLKRPAVEETLTVSALILPMPFLFLLAIPGAHLIVGLMY